MDPAPRAAIDDFLAHAPFAVAGASRDRSKYGNRVLRAYLERGLEAHPLNPTADEVEGVRAHPDLASLRDAGVEIGALSVVTPPPVTERVVEEAARAGVTRLWMQPGAESDAAVARARELGLTVISGGPCVLVELGKRGGRAR